MSRQNWSQHDEYGPHMPAKVRARKPIGDGTRDYRGGNMERLHWSADQHAQQWAQSRHGGRMTKDCAEWGQRFYEGCQKTLAEMGHLPCDESCEWA